MTLNAMCSSLVALYYIMGAKDAELIVLISILIALFSLAFYPFVPESPKLLFEKEEYEKCREALRVIAKWNGATLSEEKFQAEIDAENALKSKDGIDHKDSEDSRKVYNSMIRKDSFADHQHGAGSFKRPRFSISSAKDGLSKRERSISQYSNS